MEEELNKLMKEIKSVMKSNVRVETAEMNAWKVNWEKNRREINKKENINEVKKNAELVKTRWVGWRTIEKYERAEK